MNLCVFVFAVLCAMQKNIKIIVENGVEKEREKEKKERERVYVF